MRELAPKANVAMPCGMVRGTLRVTPKGDSRCPEKGRQTVCSYCTPKRSPCWKVQLSFVEAWAAE